MLKTISLIIAEFIKKFINNLINVLLLPLDRLETLLDYFLSKLEAKDKLKD